MSSSAAFLFFFSSRRRHTRSTRDWSSDVCSSDLRSCAASPFGLAAQLLLGTARERHDPIASLDALVARDRSEERRVGKECRSRGARDQSKKERDVGRERERVERRKMQREREEALG